MTNHLQYRSSMTSASRHLTRGATDGLAVAAGLAIGTVLLCAATITWSQEQEEAKAPTYTVLYSFTGGTDGAIPGEPGLDTLTLDALGNVYGTTYSGGDSSNSCSSYGGCGLVFKVNRLGKEDVLYAFPAPPEVSVPSSGVIRDEAGNLYGTTAVGASASGAGAVFKLDPSGKETLLYSFTGAPDGAYPSGGLLRDREENLYGTTQGGGTGTGCFSYGCGTAFKLDRTGKETILYSFSGGADGAVPIAGLVRDEEGNLYGTTIEGGLKAGPASVCEGLGCGVVFRLDRTGKETVLYSFTGGADGAWPFGIVRDPENGTIYGVASRGGIIGGAAGTQGNGLVFKLDARGNFTVLYAFTGGTDGGIPYGTPIRIGGNLYGTTFAGGNLVTFGIFGNGVVYKLDPTGKETVLYTFSGYADGANPYGGLAADREGNLYGTTGDGGDFADLAYPCYGYGCGVVFKLKLH